MASNAGLGCSDYTETKQGLLGAILSMHMSITGAVMHRNTWTDPTYRYFDLNAGSGRYEHDGKPITGSPLVFLNLARAMQMQYRAVLFECNPERAARLATNVKDYPGVTLEVGDHSVLLDKYIVPRKYSLGIIYTDPNNHEVPFDALSRFCAAFPRVEVLIHVASNAIKRIRGLGEPDLMSRVSALKPYWLAMQPLTKWQWTFLLGSSWDGFDTYKKLALYRAETEEGQAIIERLNYTKKEREQQAGQLALPLEPKG